MSVTGVIERFATGTYTVTRPSSSFVDGRLVESPSSSFAMLACIQPAGGRDLQRLPERQRVNEVISVWTTIELRTANEATGAKGDRVHYRDGAYEVQTVEWWEQGEFWKALAARVG